MSVIERTGTVLTNVPVGAMNAGLVLKEYQEPPTQEPARPTVPVKIASVASACPNSAPLS